MKDRRDYHRDYYWQHKPELAARKAWQQKHNLDYRLRAVLRTIVQRCEDPRHTSYKWYGGKGIKNFLNYDMLKFLWIRDGADQMKRPTIDRKDAHYTFGNCRFIEHAENVRRGVKSRIARVLTK